jgi:hypothetical protein
MSVRSGLALITILGVSLLVGTELLSSKLESSFGLSDEVVTKIEIAILAFFVLLVANLVFHFSALQTEKVVTHFETSVDALRGSLAPHVTLLNDSQLYRELGAAATDARSRVYNCYFGLVPPSQSVKKDKLKYFERINKLVQQKPRVEFRRIILLTEENLSWAQELVDELGGEANFNLAVYGAGEGTPGLLSVQLYDDERVFLIHAGIKPSEQPRDILVSEPQVALLFDDYFESLWRASTVVIHLGQANDQAVSGLKDVLARRKRASGQ